MKRRYSKAWLAWRVILGLVIVLVLSTLEVASVSAASRPFNMSLVAVAPNCYFVRGETAMGSSENGNFISNAGVVVTRDSVVVIDALGSPALAVELLRQIHKITSKPISHVLLTHYHADHVYGLQIFKQAGATVIAHRGGLEYLNSEAARSRLEASRQQLAPWIDAQTRLVPADRWIEGDTDLVIGGITFQLRPVGPAHTPEDIIIFVPAEGIIFSGDLVFRGRVPFIGQADSRQWLNSLQRLLSFNARVLVPGHGGESYSPREDLEQTRNYIAYLRQTMGEAARNMEPFEDAYVRTDWSHFQNLPLFFQANRMNAYNTYLLMER